MKGIILAAGNGTRLHPITKSLSKIILPIYDKPMIFYPVSILMQAGIREIMIIVRACDLRTFQETLGDGSHLGIRIEYAIQHVQRGIADAFLIAEEFIGNDRVCLALGDNIFHAHGLKQLLHRVKDLPGASIFGYYVEDPSAFGVVEFNEKHEAISLEEKPKHPKSHYAVPGLYFYDNSVIEIARNLQPSARGELEITDVNLEYLKRNELHVGIFEHGTAWMDTGTFQSLLEASCFVESVQRNQGIYIGCIEEIAFEMGFISKEQLMELGKKLIKTDYGKYLIRVASR